MPCACGESNPILLEFDHDKSREKSHNVSCMASSGVSIKTIKQEIGKCTVRCVKCHRLKTAKEENWYKEIEEAKEFLIWD